MADEMYEEEYDTLVGGTEEDLDEDYDDMPLEEQGFLRGYDEDAAGTFEPEEAD